LVVYIHFLYIYKNNKINYILKLDNINKLIFIYKKNGDWGLGIGDWGLGIGDWELGPIPNPQSPIPNPQSPSKLIMQIKHLDK